MPQPSALLIDVVCKACTPSGIISACLRTLTPLVPLAVENAQAPLRRRDDVQRLDRNLLGLLQHPHCGLCHFFGE
jgi:hypothetical protein